MGPCKAYNSTDGWSGCIYWTTINLAFSNSNYNLQCTLDATGSWSQNNDNGWDDTMVVPYGRTTTGFYAKLWDEHSARFNGTRVYGYFMWYACGY